MVLTLFALFIATAPPAANPPAPAAAKVPEKNATHPKPPVNSETKTTQPTWEQREAEFLRCVAPDSKDFNLEQCIAYRKGLTESRKLAFCARESFKWHSSPYCTRLRRGVLRRKFIASTSAEQRRSSLAVCFTTNSPRAQRVECIVFRRTLKELGLKVVSACLDTTSGRYWQSRCRTYRRKLYQHLQCKEKKVRRKIEDREPSDPIVPIVSTKPVKTEDPKPQFEWMMGGNAIFSHANHSSDGEEYTQDSLSFSLSVGRFLAPHVVLMGSVSYTTEFDDETESISKGFGIGIAYFGEYFHIGIELGTGTFKEIDRTWDQSASAEYNQIALPLGFLFRLRPYLALDIGMRIRRVFWRETDVQSDIWEVGWFGLHVFF